MNKFEDEYYPIFLLPNNLKEYIDGGYQFEEPKKPRLEMEKPELKGQSDLAIGFLIPLVLILAFPLIFGAIPSVITGNGDMAGALIPLLIIIVILILIGKSLMDKNDRLGLEYSKKLELYKQKQIAFNEKLKIYNMQVELYKEHLNLLNDLNKTDPKIERHTRLSLLSKFYCRNTAFPIESNYQYTKGRSEDILYSALSECFGERVFRNLTIDPELHFIDRPYMPDMVYYSEDSGIVVDIEIDEKYIQKTMEPIHCVDDLYDQIRNDFFTSKGWFVMRFSEDQVLSNVNGCVYEFFKNIRKYDDVSVLQNSIAFRRSMLRMVVLPKLEKERRWTKEDVRRMLIATTAL